jgi:protein involved in polysaccharide export with SLBB domain
MQRLSSTLRLILATVFAITLTHLAASIARAQGMSGGQGFPGTGTSSAGVGGSQISGGLVSAAAQQLGISSSDLQSLVAKAQSGGLTPDDIQRLCLMLNAKGISASQVEAMAGSLGLNLSQTQLTQLQSCTTMGTGAAQQGGAQPAAPQGAQQAGVMPGAPPATVAGPPSSIELTFQALDSGAPPTVPSPKMLTQFGYSLFQSPVSTFAPVANVPIGDDYQIGPGDELKILIWGRVNDNLDLTVGRDGSILVPEFGPVQVAGLTFGQAKKLIEDRGKQITGVNVDVTMGQLRTIQVFVIGEVTQPGAYTISALSRVSNALASAGGISKIGSLRRVELRRGGKTIRIIDLYRLLLTGNNSDDVQLEPNDVIFVPVIGPVAAVAGDVKRPAIYEMTGGGSNIGSIIRLAGGITAFGYSQRIQVERVTNHQNRVVLDVDLKEARSRSFPIKDGDLIKVYTVLPQQTNIVKVNGNVSRPGDYQFYPGMRVVDVINEAEGVLPRTFFNYALLRRMQGPEKTVHLIAVDLDKALSNPNGVANLELQPQDDLTIFSETQIKDLPTVQVTGEVRNPGYYVLDHHMRVSDLIYMAGGLTERAYQKQAELARTKVVNGATTSHTYMDVNLAAAMQGAESQDVPLQPNDQLFVRQAANWHLPWVVQVSGEVLRPGPYAIRRGERVASVLERCGGLLPDAYLPATVFIRKSIQVLEQERLNEARTQLQQEVAQLELMPASEGGASAGGSGSASGATPQALQMMEAVLLQSQTQQAVGRLVVHLGPLDQLVQSSDNVELEDGDSITIPRRPVSVNVLGQVYSPNSILYKPNLTVADYLQMAGGPTQSADKDHIYVIRVDGAILTDEGIKNSERSKMFPMMPLISGGLMSAHLGPGDTVYVPQQLIYIDPLKKATQITTIIANSAMALAVMGILGSQL